MEMNKNEVQELQAVTIDVEQRQISELDYLQLALIGGGNVIVTCG